MCEGRCGKKRERERNGEGDEVDILTFLMPYFLMPYI